MALVETRPALSTTTSVFERGSLGVKSITVETSSPSSPPNKLLVVTPTVQGTYPVLVFVHGFAMQILSYSELLEHISSHGFIVVAPQCSILSTGPQEINSVAAVTDWLSTGLQTVLAEYNVQPNLLKLALSGHSRGGKIAFALALGHAKTSLKFFALIGIDPVAGASVSCRIQPHILTYVPRSFDLGIPVSVIGTGLGDEPKCCIMPFSCAPDGVNHAEFFTECKPPCCYFLAKDYGHMDMLNDDTLMSCMCKGGKGSKDLMRKCVGGIAVAFMKDYLEGESSDLKAIVNDPTIAPIKLDPVIFMKNEVLIS
ncbi:chlorophyllase-1-like [Cornus florida]|uniref:chlorophyllase-1-like n=1 Tax=Cornus florida TaxID=4283 RepID=UPI00289A1E3B|nr:chlorophyllase-1-like [Cornus florida]